MSVATSDMSNYRTIAQEISSLVGEDEMKVLLVPSDKISYADIQYFLNVLRPGVPDKMPSHLHVKDQSEYSEGLLKNVVMLLGDTKREELLKKLAPAEERLVRGFLEVEVKKEWPILVEWLPHWCKKYKWIYIVSRFILFVGFTYLWALGQAFLSVENVDAKIFLKAVHTWVGNVITHVIILLTGGPFTFGQ